MEQLIEYINHELKSCSNVTGEKSRKLFLYASMIHETNQKFNLSGHKDLKSIVDDLIINSVLPVKDLNVPRGTSFIDIGTGSGIPGVVLSIVFDGITGLLIDSNEKKIEFINTVKNELDICNLTAEAGRAEEFVSGVRDSFDFCFTRAFGPLYYSAEFAFPALKKGGYLYIYSHLTEDKLNTELKSHFIQLGGAFAGNETFNKLGLFSGGILCEKIESTPLKYPRRFAVIKREAAKIPEVAS